MLQFLDEKTEIVNLERNLDFLKHHDSNTNTSTSLFQVTKQDNVYTFQDQPQQNPVLFIQPTSLHDQNFSGSLNNPLAIYDMGTKFDSFPIIGIYKPTQHDFSKHEDDPKISKQQRGRLY